MRVPNAMASFCTALPGVMPRAAFGPSSTEATRAASSDRAATLSRRSGSE